MFEEDKEDIMRRAGKSPGEDGLFMAGMIVSMGCICGPTIGALFDPELSFVYAIPFIIIGVLIGFLTKNRYENLYESSRIILEKRESEYEKNREAQNIANIAARRQLKRDAKNREKHLDYESAINIYEEIDMPEEAARVRRKMLDEKKVDQTVVQGDQVTKTEIKDSVLNRSNVGSGSSKMQELKDLTEMKEKGLIDDDEFKHMKKEILRK